jgi:FtsP/CotA-like multicopper oxidase with cupredoxin domain
MIKEIIIVIIALVALTGVVWFSLSPEQQAIQSAKQTEIVDLKDGDPYTLTASYVTKTIAGKEQKMLAYNGMIPGPTIKIAQGAQITINFKSNTDLPAALHSHGVRLDNQYDGAPPISQQDIPPGGSFTYKLKFLDAGLFWYHPHVNEGYEQPLGLYGAFVVIPTGSSYFPPVNSEHVIFLSDLLIANGSIAINPNGKDLSLMGHYGNVFLVNGQENYNLSAMTGEVMQLDMINAANARPYNFAIAGAKLKLVGSDNGAYEKATWQDSVMIGPSERAIVDVMFTKAGTYQIQNKTPNQIKTLGTITVSSDVADPSYATQFNSLQGNKAVETSIDPFRSYFDKAPDKKLILSVNFTGMMAAHMQSMGMGGMDMHSMNMSGTEDGIEWDDSDGMMQMMNSMATAAETNWKITDAATGKSNMDIDWTLKKDQPIKIEIYNDPHSMHPMQHPIHFHGNRFLVLSINGVKQTDMVWKDTVMVPAGATVDILLDPSNPGTWMAHCHIAEHLAAGMMFTYQVK